MAEGQITQPAANVRSVASDLEGLRRMITDGVTYTTQLVEAEHSRLDWFSRYLFPSNERDRMGGIAGLVYKTIHTTNYAVGTSLGLLLSELEPVLGEKSSSPTKESLLAVVNGVIGDYLQEKKNSLEIPMQFRFDGVPQTDEMLVERLKQANGQLLVLIHGSCQNDLLWTRDGHNHGLLLEEELGITPLYLNYNTGLHISENGKSFASLLNQLIGLSEQPLKLHILAHSMGGLVSRSACHYASLQKEQFNSNHWLEQLQTMIFLGTPHHGAILERGGKWLDYLLGVHPYSEPFSWLMKIRSNGVMDLGHGNICDDDWQECSDTTDRRKPTPLPQGVDCYAIAAITNAQSGHFNDHIVGDGLVTESSALGEGHPNAELNLSIPSSHRKTIRGVGHAQLLCSKEAYDIIKSIFDTKTLLPASGCD